MTFQQFIELYDYPGSIVLLEGKRDVRAEDMDALTAIGELLASQTQHIVFRSGNAPGSDELFSKGVAAIDHKRLEVITPYSGHRKKQNIAYTTHDLDGINLMEEPEVVYGSKLKPSLVKAVDDYVQGVQNKMTIKASYLIRDTVKVTGTNSGIPKATFALFYDDLSQPKSGGTGHTMDVCIANQVPYVNQEVWIQWLKK